MPFDVALVDHSAVPSDILIAEIASQLHDLKKNQSQIAVALNVDRTTIVRALRWIKNVPVYVRREYREV